MKNANKTEDISNTQYYEKTFLSYAPSCVQYRADGTK